MQRINRRKMGLTVGNVIRVLRELKDEGRLCDYGERGPNGTLNVDVSGLAVAIADKLAGENPKGWEDIDWDLVLTYIEWLLELLIKYVPLIFTLF